MKLSQLVAAVLAATAAPGFAFQSPATSAAPRVGPGRRGGNRHAPRSRVPGPRQPAGSKLSRMVSEARLVR